MKYTFFVCYLFTVNIISSSLAGRIKKLNGAAYVLSQQTVQKQKKPSDHRELFINKIKHTGSQTLVYIVDQTLTLCLRVTAEKTLVCKRVQTV